MKYTKQGLRDLNDLPSPKREKAHIPKECDHRDMCECHVGCGHYNCPNCGLSFDHFAEM